MGFLPEPVWWLALAYNCDLNLERSKAIVSAWRETSGQPLAALFSNLPEASQIVGLSGPEMRAVEEAGSYAAAWQKNLSNLEMEGIGVILQSEAAYPRRLMLSMPKAAQPLFLFARGDVSLLNQVSLGVIGGAGTASDLDAAGFELGALLAEEGVAVNSGLSRGVGEAVVAGALSSRAGRAIVTLPMGMRGINLGSTVKAGLDAGNVLLLSPFHPDAPFTTQRAEARYSLIAGIAHGILYFGDNGSHAPGDTAATAAEKGYPVYVWDDAFEDETTRQQIERVLEKGGLPLTGSQDVLEMIELLQQDQPLPTHYAPEAIEKEAQEQLAPIDPEAALALLAQSGRVPERLARRLQKQEPRGQQP
jgi:predicted Rossmann fold nucleotide-binding protein DprA/Smf involved in DNA uptake